VQGDGRGTRLGGRRIARAAGCADWGGVSLEVVRVGSFLVARTARHREYLRRELAQSLRWGADVREADPGEVSGRVSYYQPAGEEYALWCPEDIYIEEPASLIAAYLAACR